MNTPIYDFAMAYNLAGGARFHVPGHKGVGRLGIEGLDITEIKGADLLCDPDGIIAQSQSAAARLFGAGSTYFSTEGSSLCVKAMLMAAHEAALKKDLRLKTRYEGKKRHYVLAARNVHRSMIDGCAVLDLDVEFIKDENGGILAGTVEPDDVGRGLKQASAGCLPMAVYVTSPDYVGNMADIRAISAECKKYGVPLIVDNAHGAYLAFLKKSLHPINIGAAMCCDSAHKTLPALTGGAYLHVSKEYADVYTQDMIKKSMAFFGSTSPSYLVLESLDLCNAYIESKYGKRLEECIKRVNETKEAMSDMGIDIKKTEPLKIVVDAASCGYEGREISDEMRKYGIECEYADDALAVLMASPENKTSDYDLCLEWAKNSRLRNKKRRAAPKAAPYAGMPERRMTIREAAFSLSEAIDARDALGRVCAASAVTCPPAVPIAVCGEVIDDAMLKLFEQNNIKKVCVTCLQT